MGYFRELPNLEYQSPLVDRKSSLEYVEAKNLFRRVRVRSDFENVYTAFNNYTIIEDNRPDQVADQLYGSPDLDWVVLICAGITNVRNDWPLSNRDLSEYAENIYGAEVNSVKFYETKEVKDSKGRLIIPAGQVVDRNYKLPKPVTDDLPTQSYVRYYDEDTNSYKTVQNITVPVSNLEYETRKNDLKREIRVLKKQYLEMFLNDMRVEMKYKPLSSQYINEYLKKGENLRITSP
jgi:hypothetical protein